MRGTTLRFPLLLINVAICAAAQRAVAQTTTSWGNFSGNNLWGDPVNWSSGLPDATKFASFGALPGGTVDLGGVTRQVLAVNFDPTATNYVFANGILATGRIFDQSSLAQPNVNRMEAAVVALAPVLRIDTNGPAGITLAGGIGAGAFDLFGQFTLTSIDLHAGATYMRQQIIVQDGGAIRNASEIEVSPGTFSVKNSGTDLADRLPDAGQLRFRIGKFTYTNSMPQSVTDAVGPINVAQGESNLALARSGASAGGITLAASALARSGSATGVLDIHPDQQLRITLAQPPAAVRGAGPANLAIVPYLRGAFDATSSAVPSFITYDTGVGLRALNPSTEFASAIGPGVNVRLTTAHTLAADAAVNSLAIDGGSVSLNPGADLTVTSGAFLLAATGLSAGVRDVIVGSGSLRFPDEAIIHTVGDPPIPPGQTALPQQFAINVPLIATSLTKAGDAALILGTANEYTGGTTINAGEIVSRAQGAIGSGGPITMAGGSLAFESVSQSYDNEIVLGARVANFGFSTGRTSTFRVAPGIHIDLSGPLTGPVDGGGDVRVQGGGWLHFSGGGSFDTGNILVSDGTTLELDGTYTSAIPFFGIRISLTGGSALVGDAVIPSGDASLGSGGNTLAPGGFDEPGTMTLSRVSLFSAIQQNRLLLDLNGPAPGSGYDQLIVQNMNVAFSNLELHVGFVPAQGTTFTIIDTPFPGNPSVGFNGLQEGARFVADGVEFQITYAGGPNAGDVVLTVVPEPAAMGICTFLVLSGCRRRFIR